MARPVGRLGVDLVQVGDHGLHRGVQAVEVQTVEADLAACPADAVVVVAEPADEVEDVGVAPHPGRESPESRQGVDGLGIVAAAADEAVDAIGVGPVGLDGHGVEALLADQPLGDLRTLAIKLVRAVRRLADQDEAGVADQLQEGIIVVGRTRSRCTAVTHGLRRGGRGISLGGLPYSSLQLLMVFPSGPSSRRRPVRGGRGPPRRWSGRNPRTRPRRRRMARA